MFSTPPKTGGRLSPTLPICSAGLLGFWILPFCFAYFLRQLSIERGKMV